MAQFSRINPGTAALQSERADGYLLNALHARSYTRANTIIRTIARQKSAGDYRPNSDRNGEVTIVNR